jgi:hypothetical protein
MMPAPKDSPTAKGGKALATLRIRNAPSLTGQIIGRIQEGDHALFLLDRMVFADGYLWTPLADNTGRHIAYASLNDQNHVSEYFLDTVDERQTVTEQQTLAQIREASAKLRHRNSFYETIFMHSVSDSVNEPDPTKEVYDLNRRHPGKHIQYGLDIIDAMLSLFQMYPLPPLDDRATPYSEWGIGDRPILFTPRSPRIDLYMLQSALEYAAFLRFDKSKLHVRYRDKSKEWIESATTSAGYDMLLVASMIETMVNLLGGPSPLDRREEMPLDRRYSDYDTLAKLIAAQGKPAIVVTPQGESTPYVPPQATTSELYTAPSQPAKTGDLDLAELIAPLVEKLAKLAIKALMDYLNNRAVPQ